MFGILGAIKAGLSLADDVTVAVHDAQERKAGGAEVQAAADALIIAAQQRMLEVGSMSFDAEGRLADGTF